MSSSQFSSSPPGSTTLLSEHKPIPAAQSKVHDLARRYSAMAKQSGGGAEALVLPHDTKNRARGGSFGRTEGSKVSSLLGKYKETTQAAAATVPGSSAQNPVGRLGSKESESLWAKQLEGQAVFVEGEEGLVEDQPGAPADAVDAVDFEREIESTLKVSDLVEIPLSNSTEIAENAEGDEVPQESAFESNEDEPVIEHLEDLAEKKARALEQERHQEQLEHETETIDEDLEA